MQGKSISGRIMVLAAIAPLVTLQTCFPMACGSACGLAMIACRRFWKPSWIRAMRLVLPRRRSSSSWGLMRESSVSASQTMMALAICFPDPPIHFPDASQLHPRCLRMRPDVSHMPPKCCPDASQLTSARRHKSYHRIPSKFYWNFIGNKIPKKLNFLSHDTCIYHCKNQLK